MLCEEALCEPRRKRPCLTRGRDQNKYTADLKYDTRFPYKEEEEGRDGIYMSHRQSENSLPLSVSLSVSSVSSRPLLSPALIWGRLFQLEPFFVFTKMAYPSFS